jgi:hypothetical protein
MMVLHYRVIGLLLDIRGRTVIQTTMRGGSFVDSGYGILSKSNILGLPTARRQDLDDRWLG